MLLLVVVSAIVAFQGVPGAASNEGLDRLDVSDSSRASNVTRADRAGGNEARKDSARGKGDRARAARESGRKERGGGQGGGSVDVRGNRAVGGFSGVGSGAGAAGGSSGAPDSERGSSVGGLPRLPVDPGQPRDVPQAPSVGGVANGLGDAVENTTNGLGETVGSAAPPLEAPIVQTGETAAQVLERTAPVVDRAVGDATGAVGGVTDRVQGVTGGLTGGGP